MNKTVKTWLARLIIKLSLLHWAERQLSSNAFADQIEVNSEAVYNAMAKAKADRGED